MSDESKPKPSSRKENKSMRKKRSPNLKYWLNSANISLIVTTILIIAAIIVEGVEFNNWWVPLLEILVVIIFAIILLAVVGFLWTNEYYVSCWTIAYFPLISVVPILLLLTYRKVQIDGKLNFKNGFNLTG